MSLDDRVADLEEAMGVALAAIKELQEERMKHRLEAKHDAFQERIRAQRRAEGNA